VVIGYIIAILTQRADESIILVTVLITALPTYGASLRKMILWSVGTIVGGAVSVLAIIIVAPNFETLPRLSAHCLHRLLHLRILLPHQRPSCISGKADRYNVRAGVGSLSPATNIYEPLWRIWGILLGTFVVAIVAFIFWPEYAGDSLLPRLRRVIRETLALAPGGSAANTENEIHQANSETMRVLAEILEVADDAQLEDALVLK
jgi:uncharacterized membrane protein YccC